MYVYCTLICIFGKIQSNPVYSNIYKYNVITINLSLYRVTGLVPPTSSCYSVNIAEVLTLWL